GPAFMPAASRDHPIETPVRRPPLKIGTTTATYTVFDLPNQDADPVEEAGLILMGLDARRILAVLGTAVLTQQPGTAVLLVDKAWHQGAVRIPFDQAVATGAAQWREQRTALADADEGVPRSGAPREAWARAHGVVTRALGERMAPTVGACLAVAWFRREEFDEVARGL
ncbi:DUF6187 family protein, partial [Streptomyces sp. NPDC006984]|uniref:DUF6187 family protein n=1 Tax=Streptomyces sp. NPDC006984 TaxID=3155463 RepID=UPI00340D97F2